MPAGQINFAAHALHASRIHADIKYCHAWQVAASKLPDGHYELHCTNCTFEGASSEERFRTQGPSASVHLDSVIIKCLQMVYNESDLEKAQSVLGLGVTPVQACPCSLSSCCKADVMNVVESRLGIADTGCLMISVSSQHAACHLALQSVTCYKALHVFEQECVQISAGDQLSDVLSSPVPVANGIALFEIAGDLTNDFTMSRYARNMSDGRCAHGRSAHGAADFSSTSASCTAAG